jgi:general stress protein 26
MEASKTTEFAKTGEFAKLERLIRDIQIALLTTVDGGGHFHTRPVQTLRVDPDGTLWFFTDMQSSKADELRHDGKLSLGYADPAHHVYVAVSGVGSVYQDAAMAKDLWQIEQRAYYPDGPADHRLAILRVRIERAEYWLAPGKVSYLIAAAKAAATGVPAHIIGENQRFESGASEPEGLNR